VLMQCADDLLFRLDFRDPEPTVIDLAPERGVVATLTESRLECVVTDKARVPLAFMHTAHG
jgi:hypothetical protein